MELEQAMAALAAAGTAQNRKTYGRHGVGREMFGVSYAHQGALAKKIRTDHALACGLWATGNHDARILATMVADPAAITDAELNAWAGELDSYPIADAVAALAAKTGRAREIGERWRTDDRELVGQAGWSLVASLAMRDDGPPDAYFRQRLAEIETGIDGAANRVRYAMNGALISIGGRNAALRQAATAAARRIGTVEVDHGETGCKTPAAVPYIDTMWKRREAKAAKAKAG